MPAVTKTRHEIAEILADSVLTAQEAADLVGAPYAQMGAHIDTGAIPLHRQAGNQRWVLKSSVLAWHKRDQARRRKARAQLSALLDSEIFTG
jgi:hypothetical protein